MSSIELTNHDEIRHWAEERGGKPAHVKRTAKRDDPGVLRIDFPEYSGAADENLENIDWDTWFDKFDESDLALVIEDESGNGELSRFNKLVRRH